ncbi:effector-associated constant component EACC1 [Actinoallomurus iriomotensis]|uniref:Uncharacterized protein n=1 Tax=Actinoallomurus iriomotensis TaxID=478107 RepID=A0A9W6RN89_9ACTN|nr:hypothetical protein [Actinoallomurus iriomotensis]GLY78753.1 hypothetical protein Airi01_070200 [Actinoallomurus iriomotensis]
MEIRIGFEGKDPEREITSLGAWLKGRPTIVQSARVTLEHARPGSGQMGTAFEVVKLALESGFSLGNLALAIASWRRTRTSTPPLVIQVSGRTVRIGGEVTDPAQITHMLEGSDGDAAGR